MKHLSLFVCLVAVAATLLDVVPASAQRGRRPPPRRRHWRRYKAPRRGPHWRRHYRRRPGNWARRYNRHWRRSHWR